MLVIKVTIFLIGLVSLVYCKKQIGEVCNTDDDLLEGCAEGLTCKLKDGDFVCVDENLAEPGAVCGGFMHFGLFSQNIKKMCFLPTFKSVFSYTFCCLYFHFSRTNQVFCWL